MPVTYTDPTLVMTIERQYFAAILAVPQRKHIEYRELTPYWLKRLDKVGSPPFNLRLINGMTHPIPEATVRVERVVRDEATHALEFHLGAVIDAHNWDRRRECPTMESLPPLTAAAERGIADSCFYVTVERSMIEAALAGDGSGSVTLPRISQTNLDRVYQTFDDDTLFLVLLADRAKPGVVRWIAVIDFIETQDDGAAEVGFVGCHALAAEHCEASGASLDLVDGELMPTPAYALADPDGVLEDMASRLSYVRAYTEALDAIADELTDEQFSLLVAHYEVPEMCASVQALATATTCVNIRQAISAYTALGNLIAKTLRGITPGKGLEAIAGRVDEGDVDGNEQWLLYFEVARAMERLRWVGDEHAENETGLAVDAFGDTSKD